MSVTGFGRLGGVEILEATIASAGLEVAVITRGAALRTMRVAREAGPPRNVLLGLGSAEDYRAYSPHFGAVPGRYANRIGGAAFRLDGETHVLAANEGPNTLHGGPVGFGNRIWSLLGADDGRVHLGLVSEDGDMGFPGRLTATATYELIGPAALRMVFTAVADAPTPVNLTSHGYFNLDGSTDARDHRLTIAADHITVVDDALIPSGEIARVAGTRFDFTEPRLIRKTERYEGYDHNFVLRRDRDAGAGLAHAATLSTDAGGLAMELWTTEPGLQFYDGAKIAVPVPGHDGALYGPYAGVCLEPQRFPDGPNQPHFPPCILRPGATYRHVTELRFRAL